MKLRVTNKQRYVLGRRGYVFPPGETVDIAGVHPSAYREIKASVYLDVEILEAVPGEGTAAGPDVVKPSGFDTPVVVKTLEEHTMAELRAIAAEHSVEAPARVKKAELVALIVAAVPGTPGTEDAGDESAASTE